MRDRIDMNPTTSNDSLRFPVISLIKPMRKGEIVAPTCDVKFRKPVDEPTSLLSWLTSDAMVIDGAA